MNENFTFPAFKSDFILNSKSKTNYSQSKQKLIGIFKIAYKFLTKPEQNRFATYSITIFALLSFFLDLERVNKILLDAEKRVEWIIKYGEIFPCLSEFAAHLAEKASKSWLQSSGFNTKMSKEWFKPHQIWQKKL